MSQALMTDTPQIIISSAATSISQERKGNLGCACWTDKDVQDLLDFVMQHTTKVRKDNFSQKAREAAAATHPDIPNPGLQTVSNRHRFGMSLKQQEP
jgi:hypothetical protein